MLFQFRTRQQYGHNRSLPIGENADIFNNLIPHRGENAVLSNDTFSALIAMGHEIKIDGDLYSTKQEEVLLSTQEESEPWENPFSAEHQTYEERQDSPF